MWLIILTEKLNREFDNLTPLDARNSLLIGPVDSKGPSPGYAMGPYNSRNPYTPVPNPASRFGARDSSDALVDSAADIGESTSHARSFSRDQEPYDTFPLATRQPTLPSVGLAGTHGERRVL